MVGKGVVDVVNLGVGCEDKVGMVFSFGVQGLSGDQCNTGYGDRAGADLIYIVSVMSLSLRRLTDTPLTPFDPDTTALRWQTTTTPTYHR